MKFLISLLLSLCALTASAQTSGPLTIRITQGVEGALPIAIVPFEYGGPPLPQDIAQVISTDLTREIRHEGVQCRDLHRCRMGDHDSENGNQPGKEQILHAGEDDAQQG